VLRQPGRKREPLLVLRVRGLDFLFTDTLTQ
jgi:hypothetical protein